MAHILFFLLGIIAYSFVEYAVHRWVLHGPMKKQHAEHHRNPYTQAQVPLTILAPGFILVWLLAGWAMMLGMAGCWAASGFIHRKLHVANIDSPWFRTLQKRHISHHLRAKTNFGVTSSIWDRLFGSEYRA